MAAVAADGEDVTTLAPGAVDGLDIAASAADGDGAGLLAWAGLSVAAAVAMDWDRAAGPDMAAIEDVVAGGAIDFGIGQYPGYG
jgi:hypothetical protein